MHLIDEIRSLWRHCVSADRALLSALESHSDEAQEAWREMAHVLGAEEIWLARLEGRAARCAVWPEGSLEETRALAELVHASYETYLARLQQADLELPVQYVNSAGQSFTGKTAGILLHVVLHGQYHRGKINLLLGQSGGQPRAVDYIAFLRGVPAATHEVRPRPESE